ncbi:unnamed protein product [Rangifer tarandus platyrhynchus]|uniref:Uncharacterized protein n=2 Tax=Rangifer tarandus platyrhynchus TaxID=3082113 RepID=A0ABN8Z550_RANTA|nr:unnamed protein product [Rangifer tarandus platyrhynchus]
MTSVAPQEFEAENRASSGLALFLGTKSLIHHHKALWTSPGGSDGKESACNVGDLVRSLGWEDPLEKETANHSSILAWRIPWTEEFWLVTFVTTGSQRVGHY